MPSNSKKKKKKHIKVRKIRLFDAGWHTFSAVSRTTTRSRASRKLTEQSSVTVRLIPSDMKVLGIS